MRCSEYDVAISKLNDSLNGVKSRIVREQKIQPSTIQGQ